MKKKTTTLIVILGFTMLISACQLGSSVPAATQTPMIIVATQEASLTSTPEPSETPIPVTATPDFTATTTETETPTITLTKTALPARGNAWFYANYITPTIDGYWSEWGNAAYSCGYVVYGSSNRSDSDDLDASARFGWDWNYFYIAMKIHDENYVQNAYGGEIYLGDSMELLMDTYLYEDFYYYGMNWDDYQIGFSPGKGGVGGETEAVVWYPRNISGSRADVLIGSVREGNITRMEVAIPWTVLNTYPYQGATYGMALSFSDNDNTSSNEQQSMVSCVPSRQLTNPTSWGEIMLIY
ncbi:MAG: hypothetical protein JEZ00_01830 [Anaerolineaceae bacterium]|nr:hypothetical protein [Anaerolineaceae bacterium]